MNTIHHIEHSKNLFPFPQAPERLMGVFAHPDDESLLMGGTFALAHYEGLMTSLVTVTKGELGGRFSGNYGHNLATMRVRELKHAAALLHIDTLHQWSFPDKGVSSSQLAVQNRLMVLLQKQTPQLIITHDPFDSTQHPDHIATALSVIEVIHRMKPVWPHRVLFAALAPKAKHFTYALDIDAYCQVKIHACTAHVSQGLFVGAKMPVPIAVYYSLHHFEYFIPA